MRTPNKKEFILINLHESTNIIDIILYIIALKNVIISEIMEKTQQSFKAQEGGIVCDSKVFDNSKIVALPDRDKIISNNILKHIKDIAKSGNNIKIEMPDIDFEKLKREING